MTGGEGTGTDRRRFLGRTAHTARTRGSRGQRGETTEEKQEKRKNGTRNKATGNSDKQSATDYTLLTTSELGTKSPSRLAPRQGTESKPQQCNHRNDSHKQRPAQRAQRAEHTHERTSKRANERRQPPTLRTLHGAVERLNDAASLPSSPTMWEKEQFSPSEHKQPQRTDQSNKQTNHNNKRPNKHKQTIDTNE